MRHAFVIGGTGQIGRAVAREFLDHGWRVTLSSRGHRALPDELAARGAMIATLDRERPGALAKALGDGADAVIDAVAYDEAHADQLLSVSGGVGAFAVISSSSVYRDDAGRSLDEAAERGFPDFPDPIVETLPTVAPGPATYSTRKAALERRLLDRALRPITILRPGAIHGPHSSHPREWWFVKRMLDGRRIIPLAYGGRSRFHAAAAANVARLTRVALERPGTRILNAADPDAPTSAEIGAAIARRLDYRGEIFPFEHGGRVGERDVGISPWSIPAPFVLDTCAAEELGYRPMATYEDALAETCDWLTAERGGDWRKKFPVLAAYPRDHFDYEAEDAFLRAADKG